MFYVEQQNVATFYNQTFMYSVNSSSYHLNRNESTYVHVYAVSRGVSNTNTRYIVEFFSDVYTETTMVIQAVKGDVMYINHNRPVVSLYRNITNCATPLYIVGHYENGLLL